MRPCESCTGQCCKVYAVRLNGHDVWRIANKLALAPEQFVGIAPEPERSAAGFLLDSSDATFAMLLAKQNGPDGTPQCTFLMDLGGGMARCGVYPLRPGACQVFPASLHHGSVTFREDVICPKGSWNVAGLDLPHWRLALLRNHMEWAVYAVVVRRWNQMEKQPGQERTPAGFFAYLMQQYPKLTALEQQTDSQSMQTIVGRWGQRESPDGEKAPWERFLKQAEAAIA